MSIKGVNEEAEVVVVGGEPGGSTLATLVAMRGHHVVLLEKEKFPRWQIGESLLPSTVHGVCRLTVSIHGCGPVMSGGYGHR
jgi:halogenation protein CepH